MPVPTAIITYGLQALIRVGFAAKSSYEQSVRDAQIVMPNILAPVWSEADKIRDVFADATVQSTYLATDALFACYEDLNGEENARLAALVTLAPIVECAIREVPVLAKRYGADAPPFGTLQGLTVIKQWQDGTGPHGPWARLGLTLGHVVIESVQLHPAAFGLRGRAELYVKAFTSQLQKILPHPDDPRAPGNERAARVLAIALQAGFAALADLSDELIEERHLQELVVASVSPLIAQFDRIADGEAKLGSVRDTVLGPVVTAAITTLARNQGAFLGEAFAPGTALGILASTFLTLEIKDGDSRNHIKSVFSEDGLIRVAKSALTLAATRPELIVGKDAEGDGRVRAPLRRTARRQRAEIRAAAQQQDRVHQAGRGRARLAGDEQHRLLRSQGSLARRGVEAARHGARRHRPGPRAGRRVGWRRQARRDCAPLHQARLHRGEPRRLCQDLLRSGGAHAGHAGRQGSELGAEIRRRVGHARAGEAGGQAALARQHPRDRRRRRRGGGEEPGAPVPPRSARPEESLAASLIAKLLTAASGQLRDGAGRAVGAVMFGDTLKEAIVVTLRAASGNAVRATLNQDRLLELVDALNALATSRELPIGRKEWLFLFRGLVAQALQDPVGMKFDADSLLLLLQKSPLPEEVRR
jgi:hypothetical protein